MIDDTGCRELIARLEAATEGSRNLDLAIRQYNGAVIIPFGPEAAWSWVRIIGDRVFDLTDRSAYSTGDFYLPHYTTGIDAALTLVPTGLDWSVSFLQTDGPVRAGALVYQRPFVMCGKDERCFSEAKTPELALCAAALKMRLVN